MITIQVNSSLGFREHGVTTTLPIDVGIFNSKRSMTVETPVKFMGGRYDVGEVGAFTYMGNPGSFFRHISKIGRFCAIAHDVQMGHSEHSVSLLSPHPMFIAPFDDSWEEAKCLYEDIDVYRDNRRENTNSLKQRHDYIEIGNDVWIGYGAIISRGVKIGDGAVIASSAVVVKDVPPYTIVGGIPAKTIRRRFSDEIIERLLASKWWEYGPRILKGVRIYDIERTVDEIENRIAAGIEKYTPDKLEFNLEENAVYKIHAKTNEREIIRKM